MPAALLELGIPCLITAAGMVFLLLERRFPLEPTQKSFRVGFWSDLLGYGLLQSYLMGLLISKLVYGVQSSVGTLPWSVRAWPVVAQLIFFVVTHDLVTYVIHRSQHRFAWLWRFHEAHHSGKDVDWMSGIRSHWGEILLYETAKFLPIILLGASPEILLYRALVDSTYGMFIHSNLKVTLGPLRWIFNGPELHRWHHANCTPRVLETNFSTKLSIWDWIFRSGYNPQGHLPKSYGLYANPTYPQGFWMQLVFPFLPRTLEGESHAVATS